MANYRRIALRASAGKILAGGLHGHPVGPVPLTFGPPRRATGAKHAWLRLTLAGEVDTATNLAVESGLTGKPLGLLPSAFGCCFQPLELALSPAQLRLVSAEGVKVHSSDQQVTVRVIASSSPIARAAPGMGPHILLSDTLKGDWRTMRAALGTSHALQPFNWLEGCVFDGLLATGDRRGLEHHLSYFFRSGGHLDYIGPLGERRYDELFGLEAILPFGALAAVRPRHRALALAERYLANQAGPDGVILDRKHDAEGRVTNGTEITIEGCYTVAYPLARLAVLRRRPELMQLAWRQIEVRAAALVTEGRVAQRAGGGHRHQVDWARGTAWFLLGAMRTLEASGGDVLPGAVSKFFLESLQRTISTQRADGLWNAYLGESETGADTSGSAGIAAALGMAHRAGIAGQAASRAAVRAIRALEKHVRPDGMIGGATQLNRGGDPLQRGGVRVLAPFAMGLAAQAWAAVSLK